MATAGSAGADEARNVQSDGGDQERTMAPAQFNSRSDPRGSLKRLRTVAHRSLAGSTAIVTGGNAGIGLSTARSLLQRGAHVVLACRSQAKALEAIEDLHTSPPFTDVDGQPIPLGTIEFSALDLSTLQSCRDFAARWSSEGRDPIDLLVCNAGCIYLERVITPDGFEMMYEVSPLRPTPSLRSGRQIISRTRSSRSSCSPTSPPPRGSSTCPPLARTAVP